MDRENTCFSILVKTHLIDCEVLMNRKRKNWKAGQPLKEMHWNYQDTHPCSNMVASWRDIYTWLCFPETNSKKVRQPQKMHQIFQNKKFGSMVGSWMFESLPWYTNIFSTNNLTCMGQPPKKRTRFLQNTEFCGWKLDVGIFAGINICSRSFPRTN